MTNVDETEREDRYDRCERAEYDEWSECSDHEKNKGYDTMEYTDAEREQMGYDQPMGEFLHSNPTSDNIGTLKERRVTRHQIIIDLINDGRYYSAIREIKAIIEMVDAA